MKNKLFRTAIIYLILGGAAMAMDITSNSIKEGTIKKESACTQMGGEDISPDIQISNAPKGTKYFAVIMDDPDAQSVVNKTFVHWNVFNVPANQTSIATGMVTGGEVLANSRGEEKYAGMCPPNGRHTYRIAVYALKDKIDTSKIGEVTIEKMEQNYGNKIIDKAVINGAWGS